MRKNRKYDLYLSFSVLLQILVGAFQLLLPLYGLTTVETAASLRIYLTMVCFMPSLFIIFLRKPQLLWWTLISYFSFLLYSYAFFPESHKFIESRQAITLTPMSILIALSIITIKDFTNFIKVLYYISRLCPFIALMYVYGTRNTALMDKEFIYDMSFGYSFLLPCLFLFYRTSAFDKILSLLLFICILSGASRAPAIIAVFFYIYVFFTATKVKKKLKLFLLFLLASLMVSSYLMNSKYLQSSRTLMLYKSNEVLTHSSGRDVLYSQAVKKIQERPLLGWGIGSDRQIIGSYVHNIFWEVFLHYGIIGGFFLFGIMFYFSFKAVIEKKKLEKQGGRNFCIMLVLTGFVPLLVSSSYLINFLFAILIGYFLRVYEIKNANYRLLRSLLKYKCLVAAKNRN